MGVAILRSLWRCGPDAPGELANSTGSAPGAGRATPNRWRDPAAVPQVGPAGAVSGGPSPESAGHEQEGDGGREDDADEQHEPPEGVVHDGPGPPGEVVDPC